LKGDAAKTADGKTTDGNDGTSQTEGTLHFNRKAASVTSPDDTIFIDNEGKLHSPEEPADSTPKAS